MEPENRSHIKKDDQGVYYITCAACGKKAVSFGSPQRIRSVVDEAFVSIIGKENYLYQGICSSQNIPASLVEEVMNRLEARDLKALNSYMTKECGFFEGMDAYCYQCDCVYCCEHYETEIMFDEGFYDCTYGTCPQMHRRKIDD